MSNDHPVELAEKIVRARWTATKLATSLGAELAEPGTGPPVGSPLHALHVLAARYDRGELSWSDYLAAAGEVLPHPSD